MIGHVEGTVRAVRTSYCIVSAGGVGYKIATTKDVLQNMREGQQAALWIYTAVREDALDLFGFPSEDDLDFFELLLTVSGIGPKSALGILNIAPADTLRSAIAAGNDSYLTNVSGIGKKTAHKILFELKDKVSAVSIDPAMKSDEDALEAMKALGYSTQEAREALKKVPTNITGSHARLREALRVLGGVS
ncbi:Holliday junction branch migration protein RuvA [Candidatus Parcubacteria bacterium]|nr:MAG: Holliday junction branch migration protein RuvA [Candidatus Parcubacteria bacterium]